MLPKCSYRRGVTLSELLVVVLIVGLIATVVQLNLFGMYYRQTFKASVQDFVDTLEMAAYAAAESDRRYEVYIDIEAEPQFYRLREITQPQLDQVLEEEIIDEVCFGSGCRVIRVQFGDGETGHEFAKFRAGRAGWVYGGKILFEDEQGQEYSVVVSRLYKQVELKPGDVEVLIPRDEDSMVF